MLPERPSLPWYCVRPVNGSLLELIRQIVLKWPGRGHALPISTKGQEGRASFQVSCSRGGS